MFAERKPRQRVRPVSVAANSQRLRIPFFLAGVKGLRFLCVPLPQTFARPLR